MVAILSKKRLSLGCGSLIVRGMAEYCHVLLLGLLWLLWLLLLLLLRLLLVVVEVVMVLLFDLRGQRNFGCVS